MDLSSIEDVNLLKSIAYDQIVSRDQAERNLQMINARIAELTNVVAPQPVNKEVKTSHSSSNSK